MTPHDELALLLRPAGGGVHLVSTGRKEQLALQRRLYRASSDAAVEDRFRETLGQLERAKAFVLGIPSDVGAGFRRGANLGPQAIRERLLDDMPAFPDRAAELGIVDLGDVFVVPQLLSDEMLSDAQLEASRSALYPNAPGDVRDRLPVSPLSIAERALDLAFELAPAAAPVVLGGDHSTAWPVVSALSKVRKDRWSIVQIDAHTDLLPERLGIKMCFATWSYHANELFGRDGRLVQVGTRASRHDRGHWEGGLNVRQLWAEECLRDPAAAIDAVVSHLEALGVTSVYFSNDIDGTDAAWAGATGTPEPDGLEPDFVEGLVRRLGARFLLIGGDVMEVAPPLDTKTGGTEVTLGVAVRYLRATLEGVLRAPLT